MTDAARNSHSFPCAACGAGLRFDPNAGALICPYCGAAQSIATPSDASPRSTPYRPHAPAPARTQAQVGCPDCGAHLIFAPDLAGKTCPFCGGAMVLEQSGAPQDAPQAVLPFAMDAQAAHAAFGAWIKSLWFAPSGLKAAARLTEPLQGIYIPHWTYDAQTQSAYHGQRGIDYTVTRRDGKGRHTHETRTRWHNVRGNLAMRFDDVLVLGTDSLPEPITRALIPWDLGALRPYAPQFLAGFRTQTYRVDVDAGLVSAKEIMAAHLTRAIRAQIGGDRQRIDHVETAYSDIAFRHILLPIWATAYRYRGRTYRFVINGQSGKVAGERPYSVIKIGAAVLALGLLVAVVFLMSEGRIAL